MRTAVIEIQTGRVVNVIERGVQPPNPRIVEATEPPEGFLWMEHETAGPGWALVDGSLQAPVVVPPVLTPQQKIDQMERNGIPAEKIDGGYIRGVREFMLGMAQIVAMQGGPDIMQTPGMQKVKKLDDAIKVQRALIQ